MCTLLQQTKSSPHIALSLAVMSQVCRNEFPQYFHTHALNLLLTCRQTNTGSIVGLCGEEADKQTDLEVLLPPHRARGL